MYLNVGCGTRLEAGWRGMDLYPQAGTIQHDMRSLPWPLTNGCCEIVRFEHSLEHVGLDEALPVLQEALRVLRPGGRVEIEVPDVDFALTWFLSLPEAQRWGSQSPARWIWGEQNGPGQFHLGGFTLGRLEAVLTLAGFQSVAVARQQYVRVPYPASVLVGTGEKP